MGRSSCEHGPVYSAQIHRTLVTDSTRATGSFGHTTRKSACCDFAPSPSFCNWTNIPCCIHLGTEAGVFDHRERRGAMGWILFSVLTILCAERCLSPCGVRFPYTAPQIPVWSCAIGIICTRYLLQLGSSRSTDRNISQPL